MTLLPEMPVTEPKTRVLPEAKLDINKGCSVLNIFNIPTEGTSLFLTHVYMTSLLHVLVCYVHHLQGEPLITSTKPSVSTVYTTCSRQQGGFVQVIRGSP